MNQNLVFGGASYVKHMLSGLEAHSIICELLMGGWRRTGVSPWIVARHYCCQKIDPWMKDHGNGTACNLVAVSPEDYYKHTYMALQSSCSIEMTLMFDDLTVATLFKLMHA